MTASVDPTAQASIDTGRVLVCGILRIAPKTGAALGICETNVDLTIDDGQGAVTYHAAVGFDRSAMASTSGQGVDSGEARAIASQYAGTGLTVDMVDSGYLDGAKYHLYLVDLSTNTIIRLLQYGFLGEQRTNGGQIVVPELLSLSQIARQKALCQPGSKTCRATDGDPTTGCGRTPNTGSGTVITTAGETDRVFTTVASVPYPGAVTFTSGANTGRQIFVESSDGGVVGLRFPAPYPIEDGATFDFRDWCPGSVEACIAFGQINNFRGEPYRQESVGDALTTPGAAV